MSLGLVHVAVCPGDQRPDIIFLPDRRNANRGPAADLLPVHFGLAASGDLMNMKPSSGAVQMRERTERCPYR